EPPINGSTIPAITADTKPAIGGAPETMAIPIDTGVATNETTKPANKSCFQCFKPFQPFSGFSLYSGIEYDFASRLIGLYLFRFRILACLVLSWMFML